MEINLMFFVNCILMGFALAMDAFSVSVANALAEPDMKRRKMVWIAATFGIFQLIMPMLGWLLIRFLSETFDFFSKCIPWIALFVLSLLGIRTIIESIRNKDSHSSNLLTPTVLLAQGIATSIDALSTGLTIADYSFFWALIEALIIGAVTFGICITGLIIGRTLGRRIKIWSGIVGGIILIGIGVEIFLTGIL